MDILHLIISLLLPWIGSYCWLAALEARASRQPAHPMRQAGQAFFLGMALLSGLILAQSRLTGAVNYWPIMGMMLLFTGCGALALRNTTTVKFRSDAASTNPLYKVLFWLFAGWALLHLALIAIEILHRPVFPWDAWQTWIYRSKAWFYLGNVTALDSPMAWEQGKAAASYNTYGAGYPRFVSVLAFWSATAMGSWHEPLVNLPTLLCGIALALAFYGHCREAELPKWASALGVYALLSIPLIGSHLALAGQADIWQTGFTGLGFTALIWGIIRGSLWQGGLGLLLIVLGVTVKNEGLVWLLAALVLLVVSARPRLSAIVASMGAALMLIAWVSGIHFIEVPLLGGLGVSDGRIHIPLIGNFALMEFSLWDDYWANFFLSSTWHLLWPLIITCTVGLIALPRGPLRQVVFIFFALLLATQLAIFSLTEQGLWAEDWTAINRLPMHMVPALIFCVLLAWKELANYRAAPEPRLGHWVAPTAAALITLALAGIFLINQYPPTKGHSRSFDATQLGIVVGGGQIKGTVGFINRFDNDIAVLSSGRVRVNTEDAKILRLDTGGANTSERRFFWRNGTGPDDLHSIDIGEAGQKTIHLGMSPEWRGTVSEVGLLFYEDEDRAVEVRSLELATRSTSDMLTLTWQDWTSMSNWSQKSVHYVPAGAESAPIKLPLLMAAWLLATVLLGMLLIRLNPAPQVGIAACVIIAWLVLDLRWTANLLGQVAETRHYYSDHEATHLDIALDKELRDFALAASEKIGITKAPVLVISENDDLNFEALRIKYHLLPTPAHVRKGASIDQHPAMPMDKVIVIRSPYLPPGETPLKAAQVAEQISARLKRRYEVKLDTEDGMLLEAKTP